MLTNKQVKTSIELLKQDKIVILPTDTIYGLTARFTPENESKINELKHSDLNKPLIVLVNKLKQAEELINITPEIKKNFLDVNPTTIIGKSFDGKTTYAIRLIKRLDISKIISEVGPLYSTSVNDSGKKPIRRYTKLKKFNKNVELFFDLSWRQKKNPSKIYDSITKQWVR